MRELPLCELKERSAARVKRNDVFQQLIRCSDVLSGLKEKLDSVSLTWTDYKFLIANEGKDFELLKEKTDIPTTAFKVGNHLFDRERMASDEYVLKVNEIWAKNLSTDISLTEAFYIICDYINGP
jgi:hypothetical protein